MLIIDSDPQGNTTTGFGVSKPDTMLSLYDVLVGKTSMASIISKTEVKLLDLVPADMNLAALEVELVDIENTRHQLKNNVEGVADSYDYIIIDCPPSLGLLTINDFVSSSSVVIQLQC